MPCTHIRKITCLQFIVPRRKGVMVRKLLAIMSVAAMVAWWWLSLPPNQTSKALPFPYPLKQDLDHFRSNRSLKSYLDNIKLLIEPSTEKCKKDPLLVITVVSSTPQHFEYRRSIRSSWGKRLPTFFLMGLTVTSIENEMNQNYNEAKQYRDIIIYQFQDHYQNLTIKTALLIKWAAKSCPMMKFLLKIDDDILLNPWALETLIQNNSEADLIGHRYYNKPVIRDEYNKWYVPRWLYKQDSIQEYLAGCAYIINGRHLNRILNAAYEVPLINMEDIYFTSLVAKQKLGLKLTHDYRLSPYKPALKAACSYWALASTHSYTPYEITNIWPYLEKIGKRFEKGRKVCLLFEKYISIEGYLY